MKRHIMPILLFIVLITGSCTKDFEQINTDPTKGSTIAPGQQLAGAAYFLSGGREAGYPNMYLFLPYAQYVNGAYGMRSGTLYARQDFYNDRIWEIYYNKSLKQLVDMLNRCKNDPSLVNYVAAGRILKVYIFSILTDCYGDIPYSQAGAAFYDKVYTPVYDKQQDIYNDFFKELDEAVKQFDASKEAIANDIVYKGVIDNWKKLANSLRLRLALRMSKIAPEVAAREAKAAVSGGVMTSADDNFKMIHENFNFPDLRGNGLSQAFAETETFKYVMGCATFVKYLKDEHDPRLPVFFINRNEANEDITAKTNFFPIVPGNYWWDAWDGFTAPDGTVIPHQFKFTRINTAFCDFKNSYLHLGYAEVEFLVAEAAARGWVAENANQHYQSGIRQAMKQLEMYSGVAPVSPGLVNDFITAHPLDQSKAIEQINMQKWVALFPNGVEAFANQRRTGYPVLSPISDLAGENETGGKPFKRLFYPSTEAYNNTKNYEDALKRIGGKNDWLRPVWWDK